MRDPGSPIEARVSPGIARIEPWVAWSLAACTAWVALFSFLSVPVLWLFVLYAGLLGKWCHVHPARRQGQLFLHGTLLIGAAYVLHGHTSDRFGGPNGLLFFWTAIPALAYALMLKPRWAAALVGLAAAEFAVTTIMRGQAGTHALAQAGFLLIFPMLLAVPFGQAMRKPDEMLENSRVDPSTGLLNKEGLLIHGDEMLQACRKDRRPVTMAVFGFNDLLTVREMYGRKLGHKALVMLARKFQTVAGSRGLVARTGPVEFTIMLPGMDRAKAAHSIAQLLGDPMRLEFDISGEEIVMAPSVALEAARSGDSVDGLLAELSAELRGMREGEGDSIISSLGQTMPPKTAPKTEPKPAAPTAKTFTLPDDTQEGTYASDLPSTMPLNLSGR